MSDPLLPNRFGCFTSPLHRPGEDPYLLLRGDLELAETLDGLGYDEFWIGEHHSGGWATLSSPELFIAAAAQRTRRIRLATGVLGIPYHNPFLVAERAVLLDHLTDGRFILGVGSGAYAADMKILGIDPATSRRRLAEGLEVVTELLAGATVTRTTDWFDLVDAAVQVRPSHGPIEVVAASAATPFSMKLAGRLGIDALSHVAPPWGAIRPGQSLGTENLPAQWEHLVAESHDPPARARWRLAVPVHVSDSKEQARAELLDGWIAQRSDLYADILGVPIPRSRAAQEKAFDYTVDNGGIIAGSPVDCAAAIRELAARSGGFGTLLISYQDWAPPAARARSLELFAKQVIPNLTGALDGVDRSQRWVSRQRHGVSDAVAQGRAVALEGSRA